MNKIHPIQQKILFDLLYSTSLKFSQIKPLEMESTQFLFHMKKLIDLGYVVKDTNGYFLTDVGKEYANKMDVEKIERAEQSKVTTIFCCVREVNDNKEFLLYKRLKNPFYGCFGFPTKKTLFGSTLKDTAIYGLKRETGLEPSTEPVLFGIRHYLIYSPSKILLEDKLMHSFLVYNPKGILEPGLDGEYFWIKERDIKKTVTKPQEEFYEIYKTLTDYKGTLTFKEIILTTEKF